jgi:hypothetical protein
LQQKEKYRKNGDKSGSEKRAWMQHLSLCARKEYELKSEELVPELGLALLSRASRWLRELRWSPAPMTIHEAL